MSDSNNHDSSEPSGRDPAADETQALSPFPRRDPADYSDDQSFLDQVAEDYMTALDAGEPPSREELLSLYPEHRRELEEFLRGYEGVGAATVSLPELDQGDPDRIGPYRILDRLGEGGMGSVFLAEQREPVRRRVALKVIKLGIDTKEVVARFEAERQALAMMDHPNVARVFDAGTTPTGQPYFVMELVKGVPITEYCDLRRQNSVGCRKRLI